MENSGDSKKDVQGTWADHLIIKVTGEYLRRKIIIISESKENRKEELRPDAGGNKLPIIIGQIPAGEDSHFITLKPIEVFINVGEIAFFGLL